MKNKKPLIIALAITLVCVIGAVVFLVISEHNTQQARNEAFQQYKSAKKDYNTSWDELQATIEAANDTYDAYSKIQEKHPTSSMTKELNNSALQLQQKLDICTDLSKINLPSDDKVKEMRVAQIQKLQTRLKSETKKLDEANTELSDLNSEVSEGVKTMQASDNGVSVQKAALDPTKINGTWCQAEIPGYPKLPSGETMHCLNIDWPVHWQSDQDRSEGFIMQEEPVNTEPGAAEKLMGGCFNARPVALAATGEPLAAGGFAFYYCAKADEVNPSQIRYLPGFDEYSELQLIMDYINNNPDQELLFTGHNFGVPWVRKQ